MDLERISSQVRPRSRWEAADLGLLMGRAWWGLLLKVWLVLTLPVFVVLQLLLFDHPLLALLLFWWFKPIWERPLLHILSQALFGHVPTLKETLRAFPRLAAQQWFASLTWRRFSLSRSMDLPLVQLEGLAGAARSKRLQVLHGVSGAGAGWLTVIGIQIELAIALALLVLLMVFIPPEMAVDWQSILAADSTLAHWLGNTSVYIGMSLVAPFYVAAGFSLYLHRRIWLEGWDIEIAFRRLRHRLLASSPGSGRIGAVVVAAVLMALGPTDPLMAQAAVTPEQAASTIEAVMAGEAFHDVVQDSHVVWPWQWPEREADPPPDLSWLASLAQWLAEAGRVILWALAMALMLIFLLKNRQWLKRYGGGFSASAAARPKAPAVLFGLEVQGESLPEDVLAEVTALWQAAQRRAALSLLYRAVLTQLIACQGVAFNAGDTEADCVRRVAAATEAELSDYFQHLTHHWQRLAYAHQVPDDAAMARLCRGWQHHFGSPHECG